MHQKEMHLPANVKKTTKSRRYGIHHNKMTKKDAVIYTLIHDTTSYLTSKVSRDIKTNPGPEWGKFCFVKFISTLNLHYALPSSSLRDRTQYGSNCLLHNGLNSRPQKQFYTWTQMVISSRQRCCFALYKKYFQLWAIQKIDSIFWCSVHAWNVL